MMISKPWWQTDLFNKDEPVPTALVFHAGPCDVALVKVWDDGRTQSGWGINPPVGSEDGFMPRYMRGEFASRRALYAYEKKKTPFAFVMRALQLVCIDVDGKNGGLEQLKKIGLLPPTLTETSKSGNGLHLFYLTDEEWDADLGYAQFADHIGVQQGIDFRGVGCVYHYHSQRWNNRPPAMLPEFFAEILRSKQNKRAAQSGHVSAVVSTGDELEIMLMQDQLTIELAKPIAAGKRNNTLFAIGSQMLEAGIQNWEDLLVDRALEIGLDNDEIDKIVANIVRYQPAKP